MTMEMEIQVLLEKLSGIHIIIAKLKKKIGDSIRY